MISKINFNEEVFITYLSRESTYNIIAQLYRLNDMDERDSEYIKKIYNFVKTYGTKDAFV